MVVGLFMAVFMVGTLYHLMSVGESILFKERLQDAADAGAYAAAVTHARSMNLISLVNLAIFAIYTTLTAVQWGVDISWACTHRPECAAAYGRVTAVMSSEGPGMRSALQQGRQSGEAIRDATPDLAAGRVADLVDSAYDPPARDGILLVRPMPLSTGDWRPLCAWADVYAWPLTSAISQGQTTYAIQPYGAVVRNGDSECAKDSYIGAQLLDPLNQTGLEPYQQRVLVTGDTARVEGITEGTRVPRAAHGGPPTAVDEFATIPSFALAQAEYHSTWRLVNQLTGDSGANMPEQNAFFMTHRARLRRLRVPMNADVPSVLEGGFGAWLQNDVAPACGGQCEGIDRLFGVRNAGVLH